MRTKLRTLRKQRKWTTEWTASQIGIKRRMYVYIEQGTRNPSFDVLNRLEELFGVPQRELLVQDSNPKAKAE